MTRPRQKVSPGAAGSIGRLRAVRADVYWLDGARGVATLTIGDEVPTVLMIDGDPFVAVTAVGDPALRYLQVEPYRVDASLLEVC